MNTAKLLLATAAAGAVALSLPSMASADVYLSKAQATSNAEHAVGKRYSSEYPGAFCRPQGTSAAQPGYAYKRWVCWWADEYKCEGKLLITGSRGRGYYYSTVLTGRRCPV